MKCTIFIDMLLLLGVVYLFSMCSNNSRTIYNDDDSKTHANYNINHYIDTINGHIILTTVCDGSNVSFNISVSTLELNNN